MAKKAVFEIQITTKALIKWLSMTCVVLLGTHSIITILHYQIMDLPWLFRELFDVDEEASIPTWFSSSILLLTAIVLFFVYSLSRQAKDKYAIYWLGLGIGFLFMSADEIAGFHETLNSLTDFSWALPGLIIVVIVGLAYLSFLRSLPSESAIRFILAGAVFVGGAVGVELATEPYLYNDALNTMAYNLWTPVEEGMEMGGVLIFLSSLFDYIKSRFHIELKISGT